MTPHNHGTQRHRSAVRVCLGCWLLALSSCKGAPETALATPSLPEAGYSLTRCAYVLATRDDHATRVYSLENYFFSITLKTERQSSELQAVLDEARRQLENVSSSSSPSEPSLSAELCRYFLSPRAQPSNLPELEIYDPLTPDGRLDVVAVQGSVATRFATVQPTLAFLLRQGALSVLGESIGYSSFPARRPLDWQGAALARFAHPGVLAYTEDWNTRAAAQKRRIVEGALAELSRLDLPDAASRTATALVPVHHLLTAEDREQLATRDRTAERSLLLTHRAANGDATALVELFTTSLEYGGSTEVFAAAARELFPRSTNPELYGPSYGGPSYGGPSYGGPGHGPSSDATVSNVVLLERVLARLDGVSHSNAGWKLYGR